MIFVRLTTDSQVIPADAPANPSGMPVQVCQPSVFKLVEPRELLRRLLDIVQRTSATSPERTVVEVIMEVDKWDAVEDPPGSPPEVSTTGGK